MAVDISVTFIKEQSEEVVFLAFKDVTAKRGIDERLADAAQKDVLTGLYNKRSYQNRIEWVTSKARQKESDLALLVIDLDNFKKCNDTYGHQTGDKILQSVGRVIVKCIRGGDSDQGFRVGGDEFL